MRGVNLKQFDFDYDLTWMAFFMNANGKIYGRYGGRDAGQADKYHSLASLKAAMQAGLAAYRRDPHAVPATSPQPPFTVEQYPAASRVKEGGCIHCHMVYDFRREAQKAAGQWRLESIWVYPEPENIGIRVDRDRQNRVIAVVPNSPAAAVGMKPGDTLQELNGMPVVSYGDLQYALHRAPPAGEVPITWQHGEETRTDRLSLAPGWRKTDISWRASMWGLEPTPCVYGQDLTGAEKQKLGLPASHLAFRQGDWVPKPARQAGVQPKDIIIGIDGHPMVMNSLQFNAYIRLHKKVGDRITFNVIRSGRRLDLPMVLPANAS